MKGSDRIALLIIGAVLAIGFIIGVGVSTRFYLGRVDSLIKENDQLKGRVVYTQDLEMSYDSLVEGYDILSNQIDELELDLRSVEDRLLRLQTHIRESGYILNEINGVWMIDPPLDLRMLEIADIVVRLEAIERLLELEK